MKVDRIQDRNLNDIRHLFVKVDLGLLDQILTTSNFSLRVWDGTADAWRLDHRPEEQVVAEIESVMLSLRAEFGKNVWQDTGKQVKERKRVDWRSERKKFKRVVTRGHILEGGRFIRLWY